MSSSLVETVDIEAPVAVTWALWSDVTQWPRFLSHVQRVDPLDERRFAWQLSLPGADKAFVAELTEVVPEDRIAWRTTEGSITPGWSRSTGSTTVPAGSRSRSNTTPRVSWNTSAL